MIHSSGWPWPQSWISFPRTRTEGVCHHTQLFLFRKLEDELLLSLWPLADEKVDYKKNEYVRSQQEASRSPPCHADSTLTSIIITLENSPWKLTETNRSNLHLKIWHQTLTPWIVLFYFNALEREVLTLSVWVANYEVIIPCRAKVRLIFHLKIFRVPER